MKFFSSNQAFEKHFVEKPLWQTVKSRILRRKGLKRRPKYPALTNPEACMDEKEGLKFKLTY